MATDSVTLAAMIEDAAIEYKRPRQDIIERLPERLNYELSQIATEYPMWFLVIEPGLIAPGLFPFGSPPTYTYLAQPSWVDVNWFTALQGQRDYVLMAPADTSLPATSPWSTYRCQTLLTLYEYYTYGGPPREIQVVEANEFLRLTNYAQTQGRPTHATLTQTANGQSVLRFNRTPDNNTYIYAMRTLRKDFPPFASPADTNAVFQTHPKLVRYLLCKEIAMMFRDFDAVTEYKNEIYGFRDQTGQRVPGLLDKMKQETRKTWQPQDEVQESYTSPPFPGTEQGVRTQSGRGYYPDGYGSWGW